MDREYEILKRIKAENDEEFSVLPVRMDEEKVKDFCKEFISNYSFLYYDEDLKIEDEVNIILENIYLILNNLVEIGVYPGYIFDSIVNYNKEKAINNKQNDKVKPKSIVFPYKNVRNELSLMGDHNYRGHNESLFICYDKIFELNKKYNLPYSTNPHKLDKTRQKEIYMSYVAQRDALLNSDDLVDEAVYLVNMLYSSVNLLVEMGINSYKLNDLLSRIINSKKSTKSK